MKIIIDSREQAPFAFLSTKHSGVTIERGALDTGDYSLAGLTDRVAVERKSLPDLVGCLGRERDRFERELQRAAALDAFAVVVEASWVDLAGGNYRSKLSPHAACQSVLAFTARYHVPFLFTAAGHTPKTPRSASSANTWNRRVSGGAASSRRMGRKYEQICKIRRKTAGAFVPARPERQPGRQAAGRAQ